MATASVSLQDFVQEQKHRKATSFSKLASGFDDLKAKIGASNGVSTSGYLPLPTFGGFFNSKTAAAESADPFSSPESVNDVTPGTATKPESKPWLSDNMCGLTRTQRFIGFFLSFFAGLFCFGLASMYIPVLILKARKFAALNTLGSVFFVASFALLWGPASYVSHLFSKPRLPVTLAYLFSLLATLYTSLWLMSTVLTVVCAAAQFCALIWFVLSYIPGGERGLKFMTNICGKLVRRQTSGKSSVLPI